METIQCVNTEDHAGHFYYVDKELDCTGKTNCGAWSHAPHTVTYQAQAWCFGICNCEKGEGFSHYPPAEAQINFDAERKWD